MLRRTLAHLSDLHLGQSAARERVARELVEVLLEAEVDHVVVTGDLTHRGRLSELRLFESIFAPLFSQGRVTVVPGNHDRVGEDAGARLMDGARVRVEAQPGLYLIRVDSTGPHNRSYFRSHGDLCARVLEEIDAALDRAPDDALCTMLLHHHPLPLPEESVAEWFASRMGWPHALELSLGGALLARAAGRCDLVLHGHRHVPRCFRVEPAASRPLLVYNAGSSTELGRSRVFTHQAGRLLEWPRWLSPPDAWRRTLHAIHREPEAPVPAVVAGHF